MIYKESLTQSIISDIITAFVMILLIGADIAFALLVTHSFVIDIVTVSLFLIYIFGMGKSKYEMHSKAELTKIIDEIFKEDIK